MSLADRVKDRPETVRGYPCSVGELLAKLEAEDPDELAALQEAMYGRPGLTETKRGLQGWYEREIHELVTAEGHTVAKSQINEHRGKRCRCYRAAR